MAQEVRLPAKKLSKLHETLRRFERKRNATKHKMQPCSKRGAPGKALPATADRCIKNCLPVSFHITRINVKFCSDLAWWLAGILKGVALFPLLPTDPSIFSQMLLGRGDVMLKRRTPTVVSVQVASVLVRMRHRNQTVPVHCHVCSNMGKNWRQVRVTFYCNKEQ